MPDEKKTVKPENPGPVPTHQYDQSECPKHAGNLRFKLYRDQACNSNMRYSVSRCRLLISPVLTFFLNSFFCTDDLLINPVLPFISRPVQILFFIRRCTESQVSSSRSPGTIPSGLV